MRPRPLSTGERGFTLLELLVTMTVAGLMMAVVAPRLLDTVAHARLKASAVRMSVALRETRAAARKSDEPAILSVDPTGKDYVSVGRTYPLPFGQTVKLQSFQEKQDGSAPIVRFLPDGSSSGGTLVFSNGDDRIQVAVDWLTGRISVGD